MGSLGRLRGSNEKDQMTPFVHEQSLRGAGDNSSMRAVQLHLAHQKEAK
jgi:hypothetical protein